MAERVAEHLTSRDITHVAASPLERAQETASPIAKAHGLDLATDGRLIEAENVFQGKTFGVGDGALRRPANWKHVVNPFKPSWGEPYVDQVVRMMGALHAAKDAARGHEAVCVSHQLPIWTLRSYVEKRRLWHDPRKRQCTLASLTTFTFQGDRIVSVGYTEPPGTWCRPTCWPGPRPRGTPRPSGPDPEHGDRGGKGGAYGCVRCPRAPDDSPAPCPDLHGAK